MKFLKNSASASKAPLTVRVTERSSSSCRWRSYHNRLAKLALILGTITSIGAVADQELSAEDKSLHALVMKIEQDHNTIPHVRMAAVAQRSANVLLIDVREPEEFAVSHIPGAINISDKGTLLEFAASHDSDMILYCSVGLRSAELTEFLHKSGYTRARNFAGSIFEWANHHKPLQNTAGPAQTVHPYNWYWGWRYLRPGAKP